MLLSEGRVTIIIFSLLYRNRIFIKPGATGHCLQKLLLELRLRPVGCKTQRVEARRCGREPCWRPVHRLQRERLPIAAITHQLSKASRRSASRARRKMEQRGPLRGRHGLDHHPEPLHLLRVLAIATLVLRGCFPVLDIDLNDPAKEQLDLSDREALPDAPSQLIVHKDTLQKTAFLRAIYI
jgi:hypothetical protein